MFGKHRVLREGAQAKAVVTSRDLYQEGMRGNWGSGFTYDVGMRVHFDDGTTTDIVRRIGGMAGTDLHFSVGDIVPVRYDPVHRETIELDEEALRAQQQRSRVEERRALDARLVREGEARLAAEAHRPRRSWSPAGGPPQTVQDRLAALDNLRREGVLSDEVYRAQRQQILDSI